MKSKLLTVLKFLFFLGIGLFLIWLVVKDLTEKDKENIRHAFQHANYIWILASMFVGMLSHMSRAVRWRMLIEPLDYQPKISNTFFAVMIGYLSNYALPRLGEVTRCGILRKYEKIPLTSSFGTVIAERAIDLIFLLGLFFFILITQFKLIYGLANEKIFIPFHQKMARLEQHQLIIIGMIVAIVVIILVLYRIRQKLEHAVFDKIKEMVLGFWGGLKSIRRIKSPGWFLFHSCLIWFLYFLMVYTCFFCFGETSHLTVEAGLTVLVLGSVGIIFVPGGTGAYQVLAIDTLTRLYAISFSIAFAFAWIVWTAQLILILTLGLLSFALLPIMNKKVQTDDKLENIAINEQS